MKKYLHDRNKCKHCGHDIREISDLIAEITELYDDVKSWIKDGTLETDFDDYSLDEALKVVLDIHEIRAYPTVVEEVNKLRKILVDLYWMETVQWDEDPEVDENIRDQEREEFDRKGFKNQIRLVIKELKEADKNSSDFFMSQKNFTNKTARSMR